MRIDAEGEQIRRRLEELRRSFDADVSAAPCEDTERTAGFLLLTLSGEAYALAVAHALEILEVPTIVPLPGVPPSVLGIINFRGQILSVTTIHRVLGLAGGGQKARSKIIVTKDLPLFTGILVDGVDGIVEVRVGDIQPIAATVKDDRTRLLAGQVYVGERLVSLLDMEQLCRSESLRVAPADGVN